MATKAEETQQPEAQATAADAPKSSTVVLDRDMVYGGRMYFKGENVIEHEEHAAHADALNAKQALFNKQTEEARAKEEAAASN